MQKLFVDFVPDGTVTLSEEQSRHVAKALRMKKGDMLTLSCGDGSDYGCIISGVTGGLVTLDVCYKQANGSEPSVEVTLYQGVPKQTKLEDIVQKCTELGITKICPTLTHRSVSRPDEKQARKKAERYRKIALEAAQQSGRGIVPEISPMQCFEDAVKNDNAELKIIFYEGGGESLQKLITPDVKTISVYIGPEGGFEKSEVELAIANGATAATLGARILRTQTAPVAATAIIMSLTGNM